jgi:streptomycin 6-kinase
VPETADIRRHRHAACGAQPGFPRTPNIDTFLREAVRMGRDDAAIELSPMVYKKAAELGEPGEHWLAELDGLIAELAAQWSITVGPPLPGGSAAFVARVRTADDHDAVLKVALPEPEFANQVHTIARADGRGYVRLHAYDLDRHAMLQEALGPSMGTLDLSPERQIAGLCHTLVQAWTVSRPFEPTVGVLPEKAAGLTELVTQLWEKLGAPCPERVVLQALEFARRRAAAFDHDRCVVVHGDPHPANALQVSSPRAGAESGFVFVDPEGFLADPTYDLGVVLRDWCPQLLDGNAYAIARGYCHLLATETGLDEAAIWEWGFLERVSSGLYVLSLGAVDLGKSFLDTAERLI